jgi:hypothetical protein
MLNLNHKCVIFTAGGQILRNPKLKRTYSLLNMMIAKIQMQIRQHKGDKIVPIWAILDG